MAADTRASFGWVDNDGPKKSFRAGGGERAPGRSAARRLRRGTARRAPTNAEQGATGPTLNPPHPIPLPRWGEGNRGVISA